MRIFLTLSLLFSAFFVQGKSTAMIKGQLQDAEGQAIAYANVVLYAAADSSMLKVEVSDDAGLFQMRNLDAGNYFLKSSYVGYPDLINTDITLKEGEILDLGVLSFAPAAVELTEATVTATRALVEIKPDRTVFNVQGTVNSVGADAISLLRKAPGVTVDNNDNITVLGRTGVLLYVDGKRLPLSGQDLSNYLQNLQAEQIDRIDIITNPGARYEAEGNAGIIDIRLKKDKNLGANGSVTGTFSQGKYDPRINGSISANYRNKVLNVFGMLGSGVGEGGNDIWFESDQNDFHIMETNFIKNDWQYNNFRVGTDFFLSKKHTLGFLVGGNISDGGGSIDNRMVLSPRNNPSAIDSILVSNNTSDRDNTQQTYNINYRFDNRKGRSLNVDLDYGRFVSDVNRYQPNQYYDATESIKLTEVIDTYETGSDIDIYTAKLDYEEGLLGGKLGIGSKLSRVTSDNVFLVYNMINETPELDKVHSNDFLYEENVYAGYISYARKINDKWNFSAGLRAEQTDAFGDLTTYSASPVGDSLVELNYLSWFPSAGLTWQAAPMHMFSLNYGRRINRPDYNVLNPFNNQLSELSYEKGNPRLNPEIVNNFELGYTLNYRYNVKLAYSRTSDQITRLIAPDEIDPRASFISWDNLAEQTIYSLNISVPIQIQEKWSAYFNVSASHLDNQADYGNGAVVDLQAFTYSIYQQHTFDLPKGFKAEVSGYFSGPGVWGGVFEYDESWSLDLGLQRKFLNDKLNVKLSVSDIFYESGWSGFSNFNGLYSTGRGNWDSRRGTISLSYNFGNQNVKSRKRQTGMEDEAGRVGNE